MSLVLPVSPVVFVKKKGAVCMFFAVNSTSRDMYTPLSMSLPLFFPATSQAGRGKGEWVWIGGKRKRILVNEQ